MHFFVAAAVVLAGTATNAASATSQVLFLQPRKISFGEGFAKINGEGRGTVPAFSKQRSGVVRSSQR
jgi:hypothetical protein